jgi:hypothetical protein
MIVIIIMFIVILQLFFACIILDPTVNISSVGTRTAGGNHSLMCIVTGVRIGNHFNYNWTKNNGTAQTVVGNSSTLFFSPLKLSDAGQYSCQLQVMIGSQMYGAIEYINLNIESMSKPCLYNIYYCS